MQSVSLYLSVNAALGESTRVWQNSGRDMTLLLLRVVVPCCFIIVVDLIWETNQNPTAVDVQTIHVSVVSVSDSVPSQDSLKRTVQ